MFDNFQLIPGEAFTATGSIAEKVIDKVSKALGYVLTPSDTKKYRLEAEKYLIETIKSDDNMPIMLKAACISDVRKTLKQFERKHDILSMAITYLESEPDRINVEAVDNDWLEFYFNRAGEIGKEEMKVIWAKLLAKEIQEPNRVSKQLLHILSVIDEHDAKTFTKLCNYYGQYENNEIALIFIDDIKNIDNEELKIHEGDIFSLEVTGLIQWNREGYKYYIEQSPNRCITYFDSVIDIDDNITELSIGNVILTKAGEQLASIIKDRCHVDGYDDVLKRRLFEDKYKDLLDKIKSIK